MKKEKSKIIKCPSGQHIRLDGKPPKCHCGESALKIEKDLGERVRKWYKSYDNCPPYSSVLGFMAREIKKEKIEEYKNGYNQCLKDQKLTGEKYQHLYL